MGESELHGCIGSTSGVMTDNKCRIHCRLGRAHRWARRLQCVDDDIERVAG